MLYVECIIPYSELPIAMFHYLFSGVPLEATLSSYEFTFINGTNMSTARTSVKVGPHLYRA
jgi:hypothetical protein